MQRRHGVGDRRRDRGATERGAHQPVRIIAVDPITHRQTQFRNGRSLSDANSIRGSTTVGSPEAGNTSAVSRSNVWAREPIR